MSSGGFDAPHLPSPFSRYEPRRASVSGLYDRPPPPVVPPSPNAARPYDRYVPAQVAGYRDEYPGQYRPTAYRPDYPPNNLYSRSPSPDRYAAPGVEPWDNRQNYWSGPYANRPPMANGWPERKPMVPPSPTSSVRSRGQVRDAATLATPMFEPSDNWKQKQPNERFYEPARPPVGPAHRPPGPPPPAQYDSYRPEPRSAYFQDPYRRDVPPAGISRWGDHYEPQRPPPLPSQSGTPEWRAGVSSPMQSDWRPKPKELSRKSSRSSVASTHVSSSANVDSTRHSRQNSDSVARPGSSLAGTVNLYGRHRSPSAGIPGLTASLPASLPVKPETGSPRIPPKSIVNPTNGSLSAPKPSDKPSSEEKLNGEAPMDVDVAKDVKEVRLPTPPKSESRTNGSHAAPQSSSSPLAEQTVVPQPDVEMAPAAPEERPASPMIDDPAPAEPAVPEVPAPAPTPPKSPTPPPPWKDTSTVLLELKPLFPQDARPTSEPRDLSSAATFADALRAVVKLRLISDRQTRDEVVEGPLIANRAIVEMNPPPRLAPEGLASNPSSLIEEVLSGQREETRIQRFEAARPSLVEHFEKRQALITSKVERLSKEYLSLHEKWRAHCASLSEQQKTKMHTTEHEASLYVAGRTTRHRGALADAVRSDLEMEQIIASLESNDAMDPNYLSMKNAATIPDMISVVNGQVDYLFDDTNHLVENPQDYYAVRTGIDDWTDEEKRIFLDKFAQYPKQFGMIAQFIPHKTPNQCVDYYYLHKKRHIDFRKVVAQLGPKKKRRGGGRKKKGNALLADIAQHDAEVGKLPSGFVVPTRVAKGRRGGAGGRAKPAKEARGSVVELFLFIVPRSAKRRSKQYVITTLANDLAGHDALHEYKVQLSVAIEANPGFFEKRLSDQAQCLILAPLQAIHGQCDISAWPRGILFDGLDEVQAVQYHESTREDLERKAEDDQLEILKVLLDLASDPAFPFRIFIASRPEHIITHFFVTDAQAFTIPLFLDKKYDPDADIKRFLLSRFAVIRGRFGIRGPWPAEGVIDEIVEMSSGQFIVPSTVLRYIESGLPQRQLEDVMYLKRKQGGNKNPFALLDALYTHIINRSPDPQLAVAWIHCIASTKNVVSSHFWKMFFEDVEGEFDYVLSPLASLVSVPTHGDRTSPVTIHHKSLVDFLSSETRCSNLYRCEDTWKALAAGRCVGILKGVWQIIQLAMSDQTTLDQGPKVSLPSSESKGFLRFLDEFLSLDPLFLGESSYFMGGRHSRHTIPLPNCCALFLGDLSKPSLTELGTCNVAWWTHLTLTQDLGMQDSLMWLLGGMYCGIHCNWVSTFQHYQALPGT
ncbi:hypothetical protein NMY22_g13738 [Coprinellus aureogranulatus]|nr:hypothetical protein NMY22_g13738 [Coprinellus aureogranulatus]